MAQPLMVMSVLTRHIKALQSNTVFDVDRTIPNLGKKDVGPQVGAIEDGFKYTGGDPSDPKKLDTY